jgi:hypothetical protein
MPQRTVLEAGVWVRFKASALKGASLAEWKGQHRNANVKEAFARGRIVDRSGQRSWNVRVIGCEEPVSLGSSVLYRVELQQQSGSDDDDDTSREDQADANLEDSDSNGSSEEVSSEETDEDDEVAGQAVHAIKPEDWSFRPALPAANDPLYQNHPGFKRSNPGYLRGDPLAYEGPEAFPFFQAFLPPRLVEPVLEVRIKKPHAP